MAGERNSRIPGFYKMSRRDRLAELENRGFIDADDVAHLEGSGFDFGVVDSLIENAIGVLELPLGLGLNFVVNGTDYAVPMAIEEPSVLAAVSHVAKLVRDAGGFTASTQAPVMIGQIQVVDVEDLAGAAAAVQSAEQALMTLADEFDPVLVSVGGGARAVEPRIVDDMLIVHLLVDCRDAMGANAVNTMVEGIAPEVERLTGGRVFLRILSNLAEHRTTHATCRIPFAALEWHGFTGAEVAEGVELASRFAEADPYRAATHNKGIMNGVSAVCIATGNDWRSIEAGAHAFASRTGRYKPLATWRVEQDALVGDITIPTAVGIIGGPIRLHPTVKVVHKILGLESANELGCVMAAVGLAQNLGALKALATEGIQKGHMSLHARSVASTAGATPDEMQDVVDGLLECSEVNVARALEILDKIRD